MDVARLWQSLRSNPADAPHAGVLLQAAGSDITISVTQECLIALPPRRSRIPEVTVTVTSHRPGVAGQVTIGANFNSPDGSYQGPTTAVGQGQFTATQSAGPGPLCPAAVRLSGAGCRRGGRLRRRRAQRDADLCADCLQSLGLVALGDSGRGNISSPALGQKRADAGWSAAALILRWRCRRSTATARPGSPGAAGSASRRHCSRARSRTAPARGLTCRHSPRAC